MKPFFRTAFLGLISLAVTAACDSTKEPEISAPAQPGEISASAFTVEEGSTLYLSVDEVDEAMRYEWTLPSALEVTDGQSTAAITLTAKTIGTIAENSISVRAVNSVGKSPASSLGSAISIVAVPEVAPAKPESVSISLTAEPYEVIVDISFTFTAAASEGAVSYEWSIPAALTVVEGQNTRTITVKGNTEGEITAGSVSVKAVNSAGESDARFFDKGVLIKPVPQNPPAKPELIALSLNEPYSVEAGVSFTMTVSAVQDAMSYEWTLPQTLTAEGDTGKAEITVYGNVVGEIAVNSIAVKAINTAGAGEALLFGKAIDVTAKTPYTAVIKADLTGSRTVEKDDTFDFFVETEDSPAKYEWTVPAAFAITNGAGTDRITVKVAVARTTVAKESVSVKLSNKADMGEEVKYGKVICILPLEYGGVEYKTRRYGKKTWMVENLRYGGSDGTMGLYPNGNPALEATQGRLYTYFQTLTGKTTTSIDDLPYQWLGTGKDDEDNDYYIAGSTMPDHNMNNIQFRGICPEGWHVPNGYDRHDLVFAIADELGQGMADLEAVRAAKKGIIDNATTRGYREGVDRQGMSFGTHGLVGAYLRGGEYANKTGGIWIEPTLGAGVTLGEDGEYYFVNSTTTYPATLFTERDIIGFNLLPSGWHSGTAYEQYGTASHHWSTARWDETRAQRMSTSNANVNFNISGNVFTYSCSVRCVANYDNDPGIEQ